MNKVPAKNSMIQPNLPPAQKSVLNAVTPFPYAVYPYRTADSLALINTAKASLGVTPTTPLTPEFWSWKHHDNPFGFSYGLYAWDENERQIAGLRVLMRWSFHTPQGTAYRAVRAVDTATHPQYQRKGIFSKLTRQAISELTEEGIGFVFNTPNQQSLPGYLKMGWQVAAHWPLYLKPLRPLRMAWRRLRPQLQLPSGNFADTFSADILTWPAFVAAYGNELPGLLAASEATRTRVGLRTPRTLDYLAWRYGQHPTVPYGIAVERAPNGQLAGFAILRPNVRYGWQETVLTELCLSPPALGVGRRLLHNLARQVRADYLIAHFAEPTLERHLLRRSGFLRLPRQSLTFTVRPLQPGLDKLVHANQWDLTLGDLEIF